MAATPSSKPLEASDALHLPAVAGFARVRSCCSQTILDHQEGTILQADGLQAPTSLRSANVTPLSSFGDSISGTETHVLYPLETQISDYFAPSTSSLFFALAGMMPIQQGGSWLCIGEMILLTIMHVFYSYLCFCFFQC